MTRISVAMTTYNGERFIAEQLDSLAAQTHLPFELVVCDDGSTDATLGIVEAFARTAPFPVQVHRNEKNLGYAENFLKAAGLCTGDWVAFCDQDDVWLPGRLEACASAIRANPHAVMVLQNAQLCDVGLRPSGGLFPAKAAPGVYGPLRQPGLWVWPGFLQTVSREFFQRLDVRNRPINYHGDQPFQTHDKWTCMIANALGGIVVLDGASVLYRRHEAALTGNYAGKTLADRVQEARGVGADRYAYLSNAALSSAAYLARIANNAEPAGWRARLLSAARAFERLGAIQDGRARLYSASTAGERLWRFADLWRRGGYVGNRFWALGLRSAVKDGAYTVSGPALMSARA